MSALLKSLPLWAAAMAMGTAAATAQATDTPIITFHTQVYDLNGAENAFHFYLGATETTYVDVDCGFGTFEVEVEEATFDADSQGIIGTTISCSVSKEGIVRIYGDASLIDYIDMEGCYIDSIDLDALTNVQILNLTHNELAALDLSHMAKLQALYVSDNPFGTSPLVVGADKPDLIIAELSMVGALDPAFDIADYPSLVSLECFSTHSLTRIDPTHCPGLMRLSLDCTNISSIDVSQNPDLLILNVSQTKVTELDVTHNPYLTELYCSHWGSLNSQYKISALDVSNNPELVRFYCEGNALTTLDVSKQAKMKSLSCANNQLTSLDLSQCAELYEVNVAGNLMTMATIPANKPTYGTYYYAQQPLPLAGSFAVGTQLDLSAEVLRPDSETYAGLYRVNVADPSNPLLVDDSYYSYADGKVTLLKALPDSLYLAFANTALPDYDLLTTNFMVKSEADYGQPSAMAAIQFGNTTTDISLCVGLLGATAAEPKTFWVDFGDGNRVPCTSTYADLQNSVNVSGVNADAPVTIYVAEGDKLTALSVAADSIAAIDLAKATHLEYLTISGCKLQTVDLAFCRSLKALDLSHNGLSALSLEGCSPLYSKNFLSTIDLSYNRLADITLNDHYAIESLDLGHNCLASLDLDRCSNLVTLNVQSNQLTALDLEDCESLVHLDASDNHLTSLPVPSYVPLNTVCVQNNDILIPDLAPAGSYADYTYAPQNDYQLPQKAPTASLAPEYAVINGQETQYQWFMAGDDSPVPAGSITGSEGYFKFDNPALGQVYCAVTHPAFPQFAGANAIRSTVVETADMPTNVFATFTTVEDCDSAAIVLTAARAGETVFIDWSGRGDLEQYQLKTMYTNFRVKTHAGVQVKCYSYTQDDGLTVFSLHGVPMSHFDGSALKGLTTFNIAGAGLSADNCKLPQSPGLLELMVDNNRFTSADFSQYPRLVLLTMVGNPITHLDLSPYKWLLSADASDCPLQSLKLDNPELYNLSLIRCGLTDIDLSRLPELEQLWLSQNDLSSIDISHNPRLRALTLDANRFDFAGLPAPDDSYVLYEYSNQQPVTAQVQDGCKVDLSAYAFAHGTPTQYTWYIDSPYYDEEGTLTGEDLYEGEEYTIAEGVTTFLGDFKHIMCVMTNAVFPRLYLYTDFIDVDTSGVEDVAVETSAAQYYDLQGRPVSTPHPGRLYIRRQDHRTDKVLYR